MTDLEKKAAEKAEGFLRGLGIEYESDEQLERDAKKLASALVEFARKAMLQRQIERIGTPPSVSEKLAAEQPYYAEYRAAWLAAQNSQPGKSAAEVRAEALEEAAKIAESCYHAGNLGTVIQSGKDVAREIRALKEGK